LSITNGSYTAFLYTGAPGSDGVMHDLGMLWGEDLNDAGQVIGAHLSHAALYTGMPGSGGAIADLGTLGGPESVGVGINNFGQVTGNSATASGASHAFLYTGTPGSGGVMHDLDTLGGTNSSGFAINAAGNIVGQSDTTDGESHAFLYTGTPGLDGRMIDLDGWLDANNPAEGAKWTLEFATDLNAFGFITGTGYYDDGPGGLSDGTRAFLLDASSIVPEPSSLALLILAVPVLLHRCTHRRR
jgi:probable HAF family extracellular repeat protein